VAGVSPARISELQPTRLTLQNRRMKEAPKMEAFVSFVSFC
jgi:hypothetical protein